MCRKLCELKTFLVAYSFNSAVGMKENDEENFLDVFRHEKKKKKEIDKIDLINFNIF